MRTDPDPTLPHTGYALAAADALSAGPAPLGLLRAEGWEAPVAHLGRRRPAPAALVWTPDLGWRTATDQAQIEAPESAPRLTTALVPAPVDLAHAWAAWEEGDREPWPCEETPPVTGPVPGRLVSAVERGVIPRDVAGRLAVYITTTHPYEDLWERRVLAQLSGGRLMAGRLCRPAPGSPRHPDGQLSGHTIDDGNGPMWLHAEDLVRIDPV